MICVVYAHNGEIRGLKELLVKSKDGPRLKWRRWINTMGDADIFGEPKPDLILNVGFAGRLSKKLSLGEVVLINEFYGIGGQGAGWKLRQKSDIPKYNMHPDIAGFALRRGLRTISLITSETPIVSAARRAAVVKESGADAVDMEALHLLIQAEKADIPFVSFKLISDDSDSSAWDTISRDRIKWSKRVGETVHDFLANVAEGSLELVE